MLTASATLSLRQLRADDAAFLCGLMNEPSWLAHIGDRGIRTPAQAEQHIRGPLAEAYAQPGRGLYLIERQRDARPLGVCGLFQRPALSGVDLGFALLPAFWGQGHAAEAARLLMRHARREQGLQRLLAISSPQNLRSQRLLARLGFAALGAAQLAADAEPVMLFDSGSLPPAAPEPAEALLLAQLREAEAELHHPGRPSTRERLEQLLHPQFCEVGRSGRAYSRATVLAFLAGAVTPTALAADDYRLQVLDAQTALLHYRSAHRRDSDACGDWALRVSCWQREAGVWRLRYHQGTPAAE